jgi:hypothetical protein
MCSELSAASPPYAAYLNLELLIFAFGVIFWFIPPDFCLFLSDAKQGTGPTISAFVSTLRRIELWIAPHFNFFLSDFSAVRLCQSNLI